MDITSFAILGGDKRMIYCGKELQEKGFKVSYCLFEKLGDIACRSITDAVNESDLVVLPLPSIKNGLLNAPFANESVALDENLASLLSPKKVCCSITKALKALGGKWESLNYCDYYAKEDFTLYNAILTAQATLQIAVTKLGSMNSLPVLIMGWGRVGKACAKVFSDAGANICVSARKQKDYKEILTQGYSYTSTTAPESINEYSLIINTVPAMVLSAEKLGQVNKNALIIDLASGAGGVDFASAKQLGITATQELGLPGRYYPKESGKIIAETILSMIKGDAL